MKRVAVFFVALTCLVATALSDTIPDNGGGPAYNSYHATYPSPNGPVVVTFYVTGIPQHMIGSVGSTAFSATYDPETYCHSDGPPAQNDFHYVGGMMAWRHKMPDGSWSAWSTPVPVVPN